NPAPVPALVPAPAPTLDMELTNFLRQQFQMIKRNLLTDRLELHYRKPTSWSISEPDTPMPEPNIKPVTSVLTDDALTTIRLTFRPPGGRQVMAKDLIADVLSVIGAQNSYHPIRDWLDALRWDLKPRLDSWLIDYAGVEDSPLTRAYGRKTLCAAVRRLRLPGCKFDHMLILQGAQGIGKSSMIAALSPEPGWVTDQVNAGDDAREIIENTNGAWLVELAELNGFSHREATRIKSFMTTIVDRARPAYARFEIDRPRQFVLFGTTNEARFLRDLTGNRRFWPVIATKCNVKGLTNNRDQIWAEVRAIEPHEHLWLNTDELKTAHDAACLNMTDYGPWFDILNEALPADVALKVPVREIWTLAGVGPGNLTALTRQQTSNMRAALTGLGFDPESRVFTLHGKNIRAFVRGDLAGAIWWHADR
ncbi:MAG: hypothetical protein JKY10_10345, partial [Cohaesibacteraceae bacterium]|nr:hypothetical protein [Cohaesibacteraceae bacterium]